MRLINTGYINSSDQGRRHREIDVKPDKTKQAGDILIRKFRSGIYITPTIARALGDTGVLIA